MEAARAHNALMTAVLMYGELLAEKERVIERLREENAFLARALSEPTVDRSTVVAAVGSGGGHGSAPGSSSAAVKGGAPAGSPFSMSGGSGAGGAPVSPEHSLGDHGDF